MTEAEARSVVAERDGRVCVRFYQRRDGTVLTSDCPVGKKGSFLRAGAGTALALISVGLGLSTLCACNPVEEEPVRMGEALMGSAAIDQDWAPDAGADTDAARDD
jgi:hypothetical protein